MKKIIIIAIAFVSFFVEAKTEISDKFISALIMQESSGRDSVVGDHGKAVGCLQIHKGVIDEVNARLGKKYKYTDRLNRAKSKEICKAYIGLFATEKRLGRKPTNKDFARIWNGGPNGHKKSSTLGYWSKLHKNNPNLQRKTQ